MKTESSIIKFENWTLRVRPGSGNRILLLLHGWTGDENSTAVFTRNIPEDYWIIAPRALHALTPQGYSWREPAPRGTWPTTDLFRPSVTALINLIDNWSATNNLDGSIVDVAGFSQGGALTFTLSMLHPDRVRKMGILAGFAPDGAEDLLSTNLLTGKKAFVAHGTRDEMVPVLLAHRTIRMLEHAGAKVTYCESDGGHKLSLDCLRALEKFLLD